VAAKLGLFGKLLALLIAAKKSSSSRLVAHRRLHRTLFGKKKDEAV
jgi:hypothetical protein